MARADRGAALDQECLGVEPAEIAQDLVVRRQRGDRVLDRIEQDQSIFLERACALHRMGADEGDQPAIRMGRGCDQTIHRIRGIKNVARALAMRRGDDRRVMVRQIDHVKGQGL